jgi:hypothetical protein
MSKTTNAFFLPRDEARKVVERRIQKQKEANLQLAMKFGKFIKENMETAQRELGMLTPIKDPLGIQMRVSLSKKVRK